MKKVTLLALGLCFVGAGQAMAVELYNQDSQSYDTRITQGPSTLVGGINGSTRTKACSEACKIEVVGVGTIEASGDDVVIIKDGQLSIDD